MSWWIACVFVIVTIFVWTSVCAALFTILSRKPSTSFYGVFLACAIVSTVIGTMGLLTHYLLPLIEGSRL